jgi:hypothetical protein
MMSEAGASSWCLLMDPAWTASAEESEPPVASIMGLWPVHADGEVGRFRANPDYVPSVPGAPADPLDALFRALAARRAVPDQVRLLLRDSEFEMAVGAAGHPLVVRSPDDVPCVLVATSPWYRLSSVAAGSWRRVTIEELTDLLPDNTDVLFNPGSPGSLRLVATFVRSARQPSPEQLAAARTGLLPAAGEDLPMLAWRLGPEERSWEDVVAEVGSYDDKSWRVAGKILTIAGIRADPDPGRARLAEELRQVVAAELARTGDHERAAALANHHGASLGLRRIPEGG